MAAPPEIEVWIVEDNASLRAVLVEVIGAQADMHVGHAVGRGEDFLQALDQDDPPDVVLMDLGLPGVSGIDCIARAHRQSPATRVVVLTIHEEDDKVFDAICAGAIGYLLKPSTPEDIVAALREVMTGAAPINHFIARKVLARFSRALPREEAHDGYGLSGREREILLFLVDGLNLRQIAGRLGLSYHTISNHVRNIYAKLHVRSRSGAVAKALREDLV
ncbi:MAG TPA: response regulator transcription factor [Xanthomonadaceae bacterium]|nr:response regulator transcription factor [Xanthomonadaceae bacterium]